MFKAIKSSFSKSYLNSHDENQHQVFVNVYDMLQPSFLTSFGYYALGVGIYHSGVEICGKEYCFGGHEYKNITGVFAVEAKVGPPGLLFKQSISVGYTKLTNDQIHKLIQDISRQYVGTSYNLLTRNCNHFTDELCLQLTGKHAPSWINRAAKLGTMFPCVIPTEWIEPPDLEAEIMPPSSNDQSSSSTASSNMSYSSKAPLKSTTTNTASTVCQSSKISQKTITCSEVSATSPIDSNSPRVDSHHPHQQPEQQHRKPSLSSASTTNITNNSNTKPPSRPTSRTSSTTSMESRLFQQQQQQSHHLYSLSSTTVSNRQSSIPSPTYHRRPSGSLADGESIFFGRASSPIAGDDEYDITDPIKEPDSHRPEVIRSATQLSISASLQ